MTSRTEGQSVILAALLHDLGKFWQRVGAPSPVEYANFDRADYGAHGTHAKWSAAAYARFIPSAWQSGTYDVLTHHTPRGYTGKLIALADHLSASERAETAGTARRRGHRRLRAPLGGLCRRGGGSGEDR